MTIHDHRNYDSDCVAFGDMARPNMKKVCIVNYHPVDFGDENIVQTQTFFSIEDGLFNIQHNIDKGVFEGLEIKTKGWYFGSDGPSFQIVFENGGEVKMFQKEISGYTIN